MEFWCDRVWVVVSDSFEGYAWGWGWEREVGIVLLYRAKNICRVCYRGRIFELSSLPATISTQWHFWVRFVSTKWVGNGPQSSARLFFSCCTSQTWQLSATFDPEPVKILEAVGDMVLAHSHTWLSSILEFLQAPSLVGKENVQFVWSPWYLRRMAAANSREPLVSTNYKISHLSLPAEELFLRKGFGIPVLWAVNIFLKSGVRSESGCGEKSKTRR